MASVLNTVLNATGINGAILPTGWQNNWEEVDQWNFAVITINTPVIGTITLHWANTDRTSFPNVLDAGAVGADVIAVETINVDAGTFTFIRDHRGQWFRSKFTLGATTAAGQQINMSVNYKNSGTQMKIADESNITTIGGATGNYTFRTVVSDTSGLMLKNTGSATGNALNTTLRDNTGTSMSFTADGRSLITAISDASGLVISNANHTAFGTMSNSVGVSQATTGTLNGTSTAGVANFLALSDGVGSTVTSFRTLDKTTYTGNSVYTTLCTSGGLINSATNPLYVDISADPMEGVRAFDFSTGLSRNGTTITQFSNSSVNLFNIYVYNDSATTAWVKLYDISAGAADLLNHTAISSATINASTYTFTADPSGNYTTDVIQTGSTTNAQLSYTLTKTIQPVGMAGAAVAQITFTINTAVTPGGGYWTFTSAGYPIGQIYFNAQVPSGGDVPKGLYQMGDTPTGAPFGAFSLKRVADGTYLSIPTTGLKYNINITTSVLVGLHAGDDVYASPLTTVAKGGVGYSTGAATLALTVGGVATLNVNIVARPDYSAMDTFVVQNIACAAKSFREITYPRGVAFNNGMHVRATLDPGYSSIRSPAANQIFVNGMFINYTV